MNHPFSNKRGRRAAFTLVELLAVITIMILIASIGAVAFRGGAATEGIQAAADMSSGLFNLARTEAIMRRTTTRLIVDTSYDGTRPQNYLRRVTVAYLRPTNDTASPAVVLDASGQVDPTVPDNWVQGAKWSLLSGKAYFNPDYSSPHGTMSLAFAGSGAPSSGYSYYEFSASGLASSQAQFVVSPGQVVGGAFEKLGDKTENLRYGFVIHRLGKVSFFQNVNDIIPPS